MKRESLESFIRSLMEFNKRVLYQGHINPKSNYTLEELKSKLFFNEIFISNMQEVFQKYDASVIMDDYVEYLGGYIKNISLLIHKMIYKKGNIELRFDSNFEKRLMMEKMLTDQVMTQFYQNIDNVNHRFINGEIYYISVLKNGYIAISFVDPRRSAYKNIFSHKYSNNTVYWKTDDCIKEFIQTMYSTTDTIAIRVTTSDKDPMKVTKIEYNGNTEFMKGIVSLFPHSALIVSNPYIYTGDIDMILKDNITSAPVINKARFERPRLESIFDKDILIEYPNDSFDEYLWFLREASNNKNVKIICLTIYRIGDDPALFYILKNAVMQGIEVHVNIELFASGESINKMWMREMLNAGIQVTTYRAGDIKVHCKLTLIVFENGKLISQIGTGNYHTKTTTQYTDFSLLTSDENICVGVAKTFDILSGLEDYYTEFDTDLLVTGFNMSTELIKLIDEEGDKGEDGQIIIKCNSLDDDTISRHLDMAASNGCKIDLIIRGVCTWVSDYLDDNVKVKSIVWDKLEHSRVYSFGSTNPKIYIGSLDLVTKKLNERIETLVRIKDPDIGVRICEYLNRYITTTDGSWLQTSSGMYIKE